MKKYFSTLISLAIALSAGVFMAGCSDDDDNIPPAFRPEPGEPTVKPSVPDHKDGEPFNTYAGLIMCGYQGWFGAPGDGCSHNNAENTKWYHYRESETFEPGVLRNSIDFWPDMSEYTVKYDTPFTHPDGSVAQVYSAYDESSVLLHFKWMQEYGIDGVFMQRFVGEVIDNPMGRDHFNKVLQSAMKGSNEYERAISVMYDLGGYKPERMQKVIDDAKEIYTTYSLGDRGVQKFYLHENDKPLIALWGVGFNPKERGYSNADIQTLVDGLKAEGFSVMLGLSTAWRDGGGDTYNDLSTLHALIKSVDVIMPWFVGRYDYDSYDTFSSRIDKDVAWCKDEANYNYAGKPVIYAAHTFPGGSALHMQPQYGMIGGVNGTEIDPDSRRGDGGRYGGDFFWKQLHYCIAAGAPSIYVAMFDEIDEGTAIYKCLNIKDVPSNEPEDDYFVVFNKATNSSRISPDFVEVDPEKGWCYNVHELQIPFMGIDDNLGTDHYLKITGAATQMLRGHRELTPTLPSL